MVSYQPLLVFDDFLLEFSFPHFLWSFWNTQTSNFRTRLLCFPLTSHTELHVSAALTADGSVPRHRFEPQLLLLHGESSRWVNVSRWSHTPAMCSSLAKLMNTHLTTLYSRKHPQHVLIVQLLDVPKRLVSGRDAHKYALSVAAKQTRDKMCMYLKLYLVIDVLIFYST